jgi:hypothetical protein
VKSPPVAISKTRPISRYKASGEPHSKHRILLSGIVLGVFTDPLPSNRRHIFARVGFLGNVFTESLPSNGSTSHNILVNEGPGEPVN